MTKKNKLTPERINQLVNIHPKLTKDPLKYDNFLSIARELIERNGKDLTPLEKKYNINSSVISDIKRYLNFQMNGETKVVKLDCKLSRVQHTPHLHMCFNFIASCVLRGMKTSRIGETFKIANFKNNNGEEINFCKNYTAGVRKHFGKGQTRVIKNSDVKTNDKPTIKMDLFGEMKQHVKPKVTQPIVAKKSDKKAVVDLYSVLFNLKVAFNYKVTYKNGELVVVDTDTGYTMDENSFKVVSDFLNS
jgi:hypothetical protein